MKKLIVLGLILGMSAMANAALFDDITLSYSGGTVTVIGLAANEYTSGGGIYVQGAQAATVGSPLTIVPGGVLYNAGVLASIVQWGGYNGVDIAIQKDPGNPSDVITPGNWFTFALTTALSSVVFDIYDYAISTDTPVGTKTVVIPEPATIALLGLGGLALLRRRK